MAVWRDRRAGLGLALMSRHFPPPWSVEETDACFIVRDARRSGARYRKTGAKDTTGLDVERLC
jgi:hypothetical protein